jgi:glucuronoarabinoxylan endo-1,4-beta-xylanase
MISEKGTWSNPCDTAAVNDPAVAAKSGIVAEHGYSSASLLSWNNLMAQHVWQTEVSDFQPYDGSMASALTYAVQFHNWLTVAKVNAWVWWVLVDDQGQGHNCCLTGSNKKVAKRAYAIGNWSKFVRPGWQRVEVDNGSTLLVTAYKGAEKEFAIVVVNNNSQPVRNLTFVLNGFSSRGSQIIPWLTSAEASLEPQPPVAAVSNGTTFTFSVPEKSVVTFPGKAD